MNLRTITKSKNMILTLDIGGLKAVLKKLKDVDYKGHPHQVQVKEAQIIRVYSKWLRKISKPA